MGDKITIRTGEGHGNVVVGKVGGKGNVVGIGNRIDASTRVEISIPKEKIDALPDELREGMNSFLERINKMLAEIPKDKVDESHAEEAKTAQAELETMVDETNAAVAEAKPAGTDPAEIPVVSKMSIGMRFVNAAKGLLKILPQTTETIAAFTPLAPFSKVLGQGVGEIVKSLVAER